MRDHKTIFIYGFAIFAMFFGSGNLVFPIQVGQAAGSSWLYSFCGLFLTGILLPLMGLIVIKLHRGSYSSFFGEAGPLAKIILPLFTLSLLGSFGIVPRCITVAHGGISDLFPNLSLIMFSIVFSSLTFFLCLKDQFMIKILGKWMSPTLLFALLILIGIGILKSPSITSDSSIKDAFANGFLTGYMTMDLFAAFFFSALIFAQIEKSLPETSHPREVIKLSIKASLIAASLLALIYLGFVYLGSHYAELITGIEPALMLPTIAKYTMGSTAISIIGIAILLSCLTTAVALNNIYARYLCSTFNFKVSWFPLILLGTTSISFLVSLLDFKGIAAILEPALTVSYPGIIALTFLGLITREHHGLKKITFYGLVGIMIVLLLIN